MKNTDKSLDFFKAEGKKLLQANPEITPGEVRNILQDKYGKMHWLEDGSVPKKGQKGFDYKFKPMGRVKKGKNAGKKNTFQIESLEVKKNRNIVNTQNRKKAGDLQTIGDKDFPKVKKGSLLEAHHKRGLNLYRPIYDGLDDKTAVELSKWFVDQGYPLGEKLSNADLLPKGPHRHIHNYMELEGYTETKLPNFNKYSLDQRKTWAQDNFLNWAQDTERKTIDIMQKYRKSNPEVYKKLYPETQQALALTKKYKAVKVIDKAKPLLKTAGKAVPYLGLPIAGAVMTNDVKAAYKDPSLKNIAKVGLSTIDTSLEVVDTFTAGLSTPITMALQLGLEGIRHNIDHGNAKISTRDRKLYRR